MNINDATTKAKVFNCIKLTKDFALNYQSIHDSPTPEDLITGAINLLLKSSFPECNAEEIKELFPLIKHDVDTTIEETNAIGPCLSDKKADHIEWLEEARKDTSIQWDHWQFYKSLLAEQNKSMACKIHNETNVILSHLENPNRPGAWDARGLVVGDVQAGKTANYIGLMAKAVDAGYKVLIVLAGITNDLRVQTQERIDDGLLGYRSDKNGNNGIATGRLSGKRIDNMTSCDFKGDYKATKVFRSIMGKECVLYVVKKNASVLRNILLDLYKQIEINHTHLIEDTPLLLIDDEADNASPDTNAPTIDPLTNEPIEKSDLDPTMINRYIRAILSCFEKSAYVGYTATPYANIFEYPNHGKELTVYDSKLEREIEVGEDLFPRSFIFRMSTPSNYIGVDKIFGREEDGSDSLPLAIKVDELFPNDIVEITDRNGKVQKIELKADPESLKYAIRCFIIASVIKEIRKKEIHNTMLVHIDRLTRKQSEIRDWVDNYLEQIKDIFTIESERTQKVFLNDIKTIWEKEFVDKQHLIYDEGKNLPGIHWEEVEKHIPCFIKKLTCKTVNGKTLDALNYQNYPKGLNVIAIGGEKLARGLTLKGLTISYFLRKAGTYDALTQMGRWFGYRDGYLDVCRVFTLSETYNNFQEIAVAVQDLYDQFDDLCSQPLRTPLDYGLRILTNPKSKILVTSRNKSKGVVKHQISFSGSPVPTAYLPVDPKINEENLLILDSFVRQLGEPTGSGTSVRSKGTNDSYFWSDVPSDIITKFFLDSSYVLDKQNTWFSLSEISEFVKKMNNIYSEIVNWTVVVVSGGDKTVPKVKFGNYASVYSSKRSLEPMKDNQGYFEINRRRITSGSDEAFDLTKEQFEHALELTNNERRKRKEKPTDTPNSHTIRITRDKKRALFLIYALHLEKTDSSFVDEIVPGFMISFPELGHREMDQSFWANVVYGKNGKTAAEVLADNGAYYEF